MASSRKFKFCIVDDDLVLLKLMGKLLESRGHQVTLFHAGTSAVIDIPDELPDCVITDLVMMGLDGLELVRDLRANPEMCELKIIMVTSKSDDVTRTTAMKDGVDRFIGKPLDVATFPELVESVMQ